ncbi:hypothetical protein J1N10_10885 [Carboxylicivirga sp. A043]|uniref:hypothetical protein n=1 Tax=Carboxylicivirga litoralis TaxID=2816963 RepID=UPI0021CB80AD|nr:hypothetical protein [Carboxylicivirga sp. A043]MCU4156485.1 hypothetical protein [Carboxylicivirga sp. A043]
MLDKIKTFYRQNRLLIIIGLSFILLMQICSRGGRVDKPAVQKEQPVLDQEIADDSQLKPLNEIYYEQQQKKQERNPEMISLYILMGMVLLVYVATKRGWLQKLSPSIVWVVISVKRNKTTKARVATITINNQTKESLTFSPPILAFATPFKKARKFRIKGADENLFPLTLMPGTAHRLTIDMDAFRTKAGLTANKWVRVEANAGLKVYRSLWKYLF